MVVVAVMSTMKSWTHDNRSIRHWLPFTAEGVGVGGGSCSIGAHGVWHRVTTIEKMHVGNHMRPAPSP
jgi:hypothetical protein